MTHHWDNFGVLTPLTVLQVSISHPKELESSKSNSLKHHLPRTHALTSCIDTLQLENVQVTQVKTFEKDGVTALQIGAGEYYTFSS